VPEIPGSTIYRGHQGVRWWWKTVKEPLGELRFDELRKGGERISVETRAFGRGRESGAEVDWTFTTVWGVRDGLIHYHRGYSDRNEARRAIGAA
jgi:ketosteroid isomerase-like protein